MSKQVSKMPPQQVGLILSDVAPEVVKWLWPGRIPLGKLTILEGDPGLGKSTLCLDVAARVTTGSPMPDASPGVDGGVLLLTAEDGLADTVRPRAEAAGADLTRIKSLSMTLEGDFVSLPQDIDLLREAAMTMDAKLMVIDPLVAFLGEHFDAFKDQHMRRALAPLASLAEDLDIAIVALRHLNKGEGRSALYRGGGSIGISAAARSVLLVAKDPDNEGTQVLASVKSNLAPQPASLRYGIVDDGNGVGRIEWRGESSASASDLVLSQIEDSPTERDRAATFLYEKLADGPVLAAELEKMARAEGISRKTMLRAAGDIGARSRPRAQRGPWLWELPNKS